jgi:alpha-tubulin suppressor-like RCC1 family protein
MIEGTHYDDCDICGQRFWDDDINKYMREIDFESLYGSTAIKVCKHHEEESVIAWGTND